jgi:Putative peptidoglycan binding domain
MKCPEQNKLWIIFFALMFISSLTGCVSTSLKKTPIAVKTVDSLEVEPSINQAVLAVNAAKVGKLKSLPFVTATVNSKIQIDKKPLVNVHSEQPLSILNYNVAPDGFRTLVLLRESTGVYGRIDRRLETIVYQTSEPNKTQVKKIRAWLLKQNRASKKRADKNTRKVMQDFQKEAGLSPDGQFGPATAKAMAKKFSMIHVRSLEEKPVYPEVPNQMVFLLPYESFKKASPKLTKGFPSWTEIGKLAITKEEFKKTAKKDQAYIAFVYFFDRVNPALKIDVEFASIAKGRGEGGSHRSKQDVWPLITKVFTIDDAPDKLYLNIFIQKNKFISPCVGSHRLL